MLKKKKKNGWYLSVESLGSCLFLLQATSEQKIRSWSETITTENEEIAESDQKRTKSFRFPCRFTDVSQVYVAEMEKRIGFCLQHHKTFFETQGLHHPDTVTQHT